MKEKIYTIPVTDALKENGECPFCTMVASLEKNAIEFVMGPSYMERDVRAETDKKGFCGRHLKIMASSQNSLGLALMLQTRLMRVNKELKAAAKSPVISVKKGFLGGKGDKPQSPVEGLVNEISESCYVCDMAKKTFKLYIDTFFYLWTENDEIQKLVKNGNGFCLSHFAQILGEGAAKLSKKNYDDFVSVVKEAQIRNMDRLEEELDWFVKKFDYRFTNEPWKNSKDSPQRVITKLSSVFTEDK